MGHGEKWARAMFTGAGLALVLFAMLHGTGALAQTGYNGETLTAFARAAQAVSALRDSYMPRITAANIAERPERAEALFDEMRARMHDAIDGVGLTVEDYEAISDSAARDAALRARIEGILSGKAPASAPASRPGLGVRAPAPSRDMAAAQQAVDAAAAAHRIAELERKLADAETRAAKAETARRTARTEVERLKADHAALTRDYNAELNARPSPEVLAEVTQALDTAATERARLGNVLAGLTADLGTAIAALETLDRSLSVSDRDADRRAVRRFTRLEPAPVALPASPGGRPSGFVAAAGTLQAQLDAAEARHLALRATHNAERAALQRELLRIAADIDDVRSELEALESKLATPASARGGTSNRPYDIPEALPGPGDASPRAAEADLPPPSDIDTGTPVMAKPEPVSAAEPSPHAEGGVEAGIRAYDAKDYARAYAIWRPLAETGAPLAQFHLGALYFEGRGVGQDLDAARDWLGKALAQGVERARFLLGRVEKDLAAAG